MADKKKTPAKGGKPAAKGGAKGGSAARGGGAAARGKDAGGKAPAQGSGRGDSTLVAAPGAAAASAGEAPRMLQRYNDEIREKLKTEFGYTNPMQVPKLEKIVINMGVGEAAGDQKKLDAAFAELALISGQQPGEDGGEEGDRRLQDPRRPADRLQGHAAQDADV